LGLTALLLTACGSVAVGAGTPPPSSATAVPPALLGTVWDRLPVKAKRVALTFDAGGNDAGLAAIEQALTDARVAHATFFLTGAWTRAFPDGARSIAAGGFLIGNHTDTHPNLPDLSDRQVLGQVRRGRLTIEQTTGASPVPWFRFPYGAYDARTLGLVNGRGWVAIGWTIDTLGWKGTSGGQSVESVVDRALVGVRRGAIVMMHVGSNPDDQSTLDADALPAVINGLRAAGYRFCTVAVLLNTG